MNVSSNMPSFNQIKETCLYVEDLSRTEAFYHGKLGLEVIVSVQSSHIFFRAGASVLLCFISERSKVQTNLPSHYASGHIHFAFEIEQDAYEACKQTIISKNISIEHEENWGKLKSFYFRDPDDHLVEVVMKGVWD